MYRLLALFWAVGLASSNCKNNQNKWFWVGRSGKDDIYQENFSSDRRYDGSDIFLSAIARNLIGAGQKMEDFCMTHSDRSLKEVYGVEHFKLKVRLSEFTKDDIQVKVRQRLVSIQANNCETEYASVRILPDVVDASRAVWKLVRGDLMVMFPYNVTPDTPLQSRCGRYIDNGVITVPPSAAGTVYRKDYDLSFGDENFRRAFRRYMKNHQHEGHRESAEDDGTTEYVDDDKEPAN